VWKWKNGSTPDSRGRARARRSQASQNFGRRHPYLVLTGLVIFFSWLTAVSILALINSRNTVASGWTMATSIGVTCSLALAALAAVTYRRRQSLWPLYLIGALWITGFILTMPQTLRTASTPGPVTSAFEAGTIAFCIPLDTGITILFLGTLLGRWRLSASGRIVGELHISRAERWSDSAKNPISLAEWEDFAQGRPDLTRVEGIDIRTIMAQRISELSEYQSPEDQKWLAQAREDLAKFDAMARKQPDFAQHLIEATGAAYFTYTSPYGTPIGMSWRDEQITVIGVTDEMAATDVSRLAAALNASLTNDQGKRYVPPEDSTAHR